MIKHRAMNVDLGLVNLVTSVVCEAGSQISRPWFWSPPGEVIQLLDSLYHQVAFIQHKLNTSPVVLAKQAAREAELARLYRRINHLRDQVLHDATNYLVQLAVAWSCNVIVIEDLRHYQPVAGKGQLSRELSNWLRGEFHDLLVYKGARHGIVVKQVNPRGTSSYCPRCAVRGLKITDPATKKVDEKGRFFHCPSCGFTADRDYTGALNIYRVYRDCRSRGQRSRGIATCHPVSYTVTASRPTVLAAPRPHPVRAGGQGNK
ncbi:MAG: RNA-guided endonuclease InsQ/TnpB family protein [Candidatus Odinarchaeota archaeon]